jgi:hypothetical protein
MFSFRSVIPVRRPARGSTTALMVGSVGAFHLWRDSHLAGPRVMFSMAMWIS